MDRTRHANIQAWMLLTTLAICGLLIGGSQIYARVSADTDDPRPAVTVPINGHDHQILTDPNWTTCTIDGHQLPCRRQP